MNQPASQPDKKGWHTARWAFTAYEPQWRLFDQQPPPGIAEWGWQKEKCPDTDRLHYQGYLRLTAQQRLSWFKDKLPGVHVEKCGWKTPEKPQSECWKALVNYCKKKDTAVDGVHHHATSTFYTMYTYSEVLGQRIYSLYKDEFEDWSDSVAIKNITTHARLDIRAGYREVCCILGNPNFKSSYLAYWKDWIASFKMKPHSINGPQLSQEGIQDAQAPSQDGQEGIEG